MAHVDPGIIDVIERLTKLTLAALPPLIATNPRYRELVRREAAAKVLAETAPTRGRERPG